jgi:hypothetical protein
MKLELKHIAPYLPYGLKVQCVRHWIEYGEQHILELNGIANNNGCQWQYEFRHKEDLRFVDINAKFKPVLRPLSQLNIEIEHNGEKFVPINKLVEIYNSSAEDTDLCRIDFHNIGGFTLYGLVTDTSFEVSMPLYIYDKVFEWNFDVFGLIEQELAVELK